MWLMLQQEQPGDYVVATGKSNSVQSFLETAFNYVNLNWEQYVKIDPRYFRPTEVDILLGDATKAYEILGWQPTTTFEELVKMMVDHDLKLARQEQTLISAGHVIHTFGRESI
jgi:GDPmannose 4,6-dehydratase